MQGYTKFQNIILFVLRLITAAVFIYAGYAKLGFWSVAPEGMSDLMVNIFRLLSIVELLGGAGLIAGFFTRWLAAGFSVIMVGAVFVVQFLMQTGFATQQGTGWNFPLTVLGGCLVLVAFGAGSWSVDVKFKKDLTKP